MSQLRPKDINLVSFSFSLRRVCCLLPSGIGQGFSLLLCISILGEYTHSFRAIAASYATGMLSAQSIGLVLGTFVFVVVCAWPVQYVDVRREEGVWTQLTRVAAAHVPSDGGNARSLLLS